MANFPIDENQEALELELRKIETSDPVHADIYNALYQKLINNDAFLERLANKMIRQAMISHVLDSNNAGMVLGADVGPKITTIMDELQRALTVLNTNKIKLLYTGNTLSTASNNYGVSIYTPDLSSCNNVLAAICTGATPEGQFNGSNFWVSYVDQKTGQISIVNYTGMTKRFIVSELILYSD